MRNHLRNISALAGKELGGYFGSPIGWVVMALFALLFGRFFIIFLNSYVTNSMQAQPGQAMNVNMYLVRPLLSNASVILLFVLPMVTMRAYSEEKRSGTIELLLTAPLTDVEIILGKFIGAMGLYLATLGVTMVYMLMLFIWGNPEWRPMLVGYLGLFLMGGCFVSVGLFFSSLTKNQIVAGVGTFIVSLLLWIIGWSAESAGPTLGPILTYLSITDHFEDFTKGVLDTKHLVYYLSFMSFGLFLTAKSVDSERWRG